MHHQCHDLLTGQWCRFVSCNHHSFFLETVCLIVCPTLYAEPFCHPGWALKFSQKVLCSILCLEGQQMHQQCQMYLHVFHAVL